MDGEEEDFMSGARSDDGGGTPVQDEHPGSDGEDVRSEGHESEDEDGPPAAQLGGDASGSDREERTAADSDSEGEAPGSQHDHDKSDSEAEPPRPADSDGDSPVKHRTSGSEDEDSSPVKHRAPDHEEGEGSSPPPKRRGSSSDHEEGGKGGDRPTAAADSDSEDEDKPAASKQSDADSDSDTETHARRAAPQIDSDQEEGGEERKQEGGGGKWNAVMQSDSEEEEEEGRKRKAAAGSDGEKQEEEEPRDDSEHEEKPVKRKKAVLSDSEDEEKPVKRSRAVSDDDENSDSDAAPGRPDKSLAAKLRELGSDSGSEDEGAKAEAEHKDEKALFGSDSESGDEEEKMIADIFGESGEEEEEEFTGFNQEDLEGGEQQNKEEQQQQEEESESDEGVDRSGQDTSFMSDFDIMLARRKAMNSKRRKHRDGGTFISDADDVVSAMMMKMTEAAEEDRTLNSQKKPALKKLTLLPHVVMHLKKQDLKETFIDSGVMSAIKEWISPLPDKSLPALRIREELLRILQELPSVSQETLKHSGIGRSVMFLYKHPKESRANKDLALKLINEWSRPIFGLTSNYKGMTREERQQRDLDQQMPQKRRLSSGGQTPRRDLEKQLTGEEKALRPGDPGFCARARVPMPSNKDYVVRPKWNVEGDSSRQGPMKKGVSRVDKQMRRIADIRRLTKPGHAVKISVEGNRMPL
ncbi:protein IWS1 homolog isoform X3 [Limanda limanda]|uniref:protein IWS1 homolog isoform X3 n=1 Tax=Limanda limanda TaxID=27771 RepID=UPI0029C699CE|nr:protein IWS1 homolog isoform X3 [Limanda limanda]